MEQVKYYGFKIIKWHVKWYFISSTSSNKSLCLKNYHFFLWSLFLTYPRFLILWDSVPDAHCKKKKKEKKNPWKFRIIPSLGDEYCLNVECMLDLLLCWWQHKLLHISGWVKATLELYFCNVLLKLHCNN